MRAYRAGLLSTLLILAGLGAGCGRTGQTDAEKASIPLTPCQLSAPGADTRLQARCGKLSVYENRAAQSGRQIELHLAVIPAISRTPALDPLFFITGGPGEASTQDYVRMASAFRRIIEKRDIVLVDQRGTGQSHPLKCANPVEDTEAEEKASFRTLVEDCIKQFDADTRFYTTQAAVDDLDSVRAALGYDRINLYGISYGTRVAQTYMRSYPKHVRAVILDGVLPQDEALGIRIASDAQRTLAAIFARCAADADCSKAFPDLPGALQSLLRRVEKEPVTLTVENPSTGKRTEVRFTRNKLGVAIRLFSYSPETAALLPLLIHDANATGDLSRLAGQAMIVTEQLEGSINLGLHNSIVCAEDVPFFRQNGRFLGDARKEEQAYLGGAYQALEKICQYWPAAQVPAEFKKPVQSDAPVLLLSGELDPVTPPSKAEHVAETLRHSLRVVAPGQGHGVLERGCLYKVATEFVERGTTEGLNTRCVQDLKPMPFFLSYTGPKP
jgi:pimeloyl-ACP methyl ester carboxylesterase